MSGVEKMKYNGNCVGNVVFPMHMLACPEYLINTHTHTQRLARQYTDYVLIRNSLAINTENVFLPWRLSHGGRLAVCLVGKTVGLEIKSYIYECG